MSAMSSESAEVQVPGPGKKPLPTEVREIKKLDEVVVNRIAAGEIIHRPANALKEMIENSLDAGSTSINVTVKNGGIKLLQIQDNGCGIRKEDLGIVCERFTTSKLRDFEDLKTINTFGFRGEALASITHVAHVTITTRTKSSSCAYKAQYSDGKLVPAKPGASADPKPCAGNVGTTITVEDLFYNMATRQKALRSPTEEYGKIAEVVSRYAILNSGVSFTLKKAGENSADVRTASGASTLDNLRTIYGNNVARELLEVKTKEDSVGLSLYGYVSNANYSVKKGTYIFFINKRLVDCSSLKRGIEAVYATYLPKNTHPFAFVSLELPPEDVDVNVHPTKQEVHFLNEDRVVEAVQKAIEDRLLNANASRVYYAQTLLTGGILDESKQEETTEKNKSTRAPEHLLVRTDTRTQTLHAFANIFKAKAQEEDVEMTDAAPKLDKPLSASESQRKEVSPETAGADSEPMDIDFVDLSKTAPDSSDHDTNAPKLQKVRRKRVPVTLTSIQQFSKKIADAENTGLREMFREHTFVGCVNPSLALMQHRTKLFLINTTAASKQLFRQILFRDFANFGTIKLNPPPSIAELLALALDCEESGYSEEEYGPKDDLIEKMCEEICSKAEMLNEYFMLGITEEGFLETMPLLLEHYYPDWDRLPMLVLRLATEVEWTSERECFQTLAEELSDFYSFRGPMFEDEEGGKIQGGKNGTESEKKEEGTNYASNSNANWEWTVEHTLFPAFKRMLRPDRTLLDDTHVIPLADLPDLYKVFERC